MTKQAAKQAAKKAATPAQLKVEQWPIGNVKPYVDNPRTISDEAVDKVAGSLKEFGWQQPIVVDKEGVIVVGHTRLLAAHKLLMEKVPVVVAALSQQKLAAYRIADNKTGEFSSWEFERLRVELENLIIADDLDILATGFNEEELNKLLHGETVPSLDDLEDEHGEFDPSDGWPIVKVKLAPEVKDLWDSTIKVAAKGKPLSDSICIDRILHCVDTQALTDYVEED